MRLRIAVPEQHVEPTVINAALEAVTRLDEHMIRAGEVPSWPDAVASGVRWRPEPPGDEHFDNAKTVIDRKWGDCDDVAPYKAAWLRATGEDPGATAIVVPSGPDTFHALVKRSAGELDDPSIEAGMQPRRVGGIDGDTIRIWAQDPHDGRVYEGSLVPSVGPLIMHNGPAVAVRRTVGGYEGRVDLPWIGSPLVSCVGAAHRVPVHHTARWTSQHTRAPKISGAAPYAFSCTAEDCHPLVALNHAVVGAVLCGDASGVAAPIDRLKLLALQGLLAGMPPLGAVQCLAEQHLGGDYETAMAIVTPIANTLARFQ